MDFETAFSEARQFRMTAALCFWEMDKKLYFPKSSVKPIFPAVYNYACAIELYFKAILIHQNNITEKNKGVHDLFKLFRRLNPNTQKEVIKRVGVSPTGMKFEDHLKEHSDIYYRWKYTFERKYKFSSFDSLFFKILGQQLDEMVLKINLERKS